MTRSHAGTWGGHRPTYQCWTDMKSRCRNPNAQQFKNYGARGITVCERWLESYANFLADMGQKPDGMTLDRIDNDGQYCPENCRWATPAEQRANQRSLHLLTVGGVTKPLRHWAKEYGIHEATLHRRLMRGHTPEEALTIPLHPGVKYAGAPRG